MQLKMPLEYGKVHSERLSVAEAEEAEPSDESEPEYSDSDESDYGMPQDAIVPVQGHAMPQAPNHVPAMPQESVSEGADKPPTPPRPSRVCIHSVSPWLMAFSQKQHPPPERDVCCHEQLGAMLHP